MRFGSRLVMLLLAGTLVGCQDKTPDAPKPEPKVADVPREIPQPKGQNAPKPVPAPQQQDCNGPCGAILGPGAWTVSFCTANAQGCPLQTSTALLCSTTPGFAQACANRKCPPKQECKTQFVATVGQTAINSVFTANDPGCKAPTPNGCVVTFTFAKNAGALCDCGCQ